MARRRGILRRNSDSEGGEGGESPSPEDAAKDLSRGGRFVASRGAGPGPEAEPGTEAQAGGDTDPASMPAIQEWRVGEAKPDAEDPPLELTTEVSAWHPGPSGDEPEQDDEPPAEDAGSTGPPAQPSARRGATAERIRVAAADAADAAEHRSVEEILALEEDLERAKVEAATKLEKLERRLTEMEERGGSPEHAPERANAQLAAQADRLRTEADARVAKEVASAREDAEREAREAYRVREEEIERARAAIEGELAATRRQLDEAHDRALAAERRATQIESEANREVERERELGFKAIEGRIGEVEPAPVDEERAAPVAIEDGPDENVLAAGASVSLSSATFDDLRELGLSVTQAKRILDFRDRLGGFDSVEDLDYVPGFPRSLLGELKSRVTL